MLSFFSHHLFCDFTTQLICQPGALSLVCLSNKPQCQEQWEPLKDSDFSAAQDRAHLFPLKENTSLYQLVFLKGILSYTLIWVCQWTQPLLQPCCIPKASASTPGLRTSEITAGTRLEQLWTGVSKETVLAFLFWEVSKMAWTFPSTKKCCNKQEIHVFSAFQHPGRMAVKAQMYFTISIRNQIYHELIPSFPRWISDCYCLPKR